MSDDDTDLDRLFADARAEPARVPSALSARVLNDAALVQGGFAGARRAEPGLMVQLRDALGGWFGVGGLATACAVGVWLGFAQPAMLPDPAALMGGAQSGETAESYDIYGGESFAMAFAEEG